MNLLAHAVLAPKPGDVRVGNVLADFVKGPRLLELPPEVQRGVRQHRRVDAFTDRHPAVMRSVGRVGGEWGWFSGILIDVFYDHILCRLWDRHGPGEPLRPFIDRVYAELAPHAELADPEHRGFVPAIIGDDRLFRYATHAGIADTLAHLSRRVARRMPGRAVDLVGAMPLLARLEPELEADFAEFFPEARRFAASLT